MKLAYKYGCPSRADLDEAAIGQLRLANDLWNALVETERAHQEKVAEIWGRHPEVASALAVLENATAALSAVEADMRAARQEDRSTLPRKSDAIRLKEAKKAHRDAKAAVKGAKNAVIEGDLEPGFAEIKKGCRACRSNLSSPPDSFYKEFRVRGLGWGTLNDVIARFRIACARVAADRANGSPAGLHFHGFNGGGTLTVQVQREAGDPVPSPELLASGNGKWRNQVQFGPWTDPAAGVPKGTARHGTLRLRVTAGLDVTIPVTIHRWLPSDAEIKQVRISRHRTGGHSRLSVSVVFEVPDPVPAQGDAGVAVIPSWKAAGNGWLHMARIVSTNPLAEPPADLAGLLRCTANRLSADLYLPPSWRAAFERGARIRGYRDEMLDYVRQVVADALKAQPSLEEALGVTAGDVSRWRSAGRFARLIRTWQSLLADSGTAAALPRIPASVIRPVELDEKGASRLREAGKPAVPVFACQPPPGKRGLHSGPGEHEHDLECWRLRDRHLWEYEAHERDQVTARRLDAYRKVAVWLCQGAGAVTLHDLDLAGIRQVPDAGREDPERARGSRRNAQAAAPGELAAVVKQAAQARGISVLLAGSEGER